MARFTLVRSGQPLVLAPDHHAVVKGTPLFGHRATSRSHRYGMGPVFRGERVIKAGQHNRKIHNRLAGIPIGTITLRERLDCPRHCRLWNSCFGNRMNYARRFEVTPAFYRSVEVECELWSLTFPHGWLLRLHTLGDFISVEYIRFWERMLERHLSLTIWGYTHWRSTDRIGREIERLTRKFGRQRFCIRWSDSQWRTWSTWTFTTPSADRKRMHNGVEYAMCPHELTGIACADCKACWTSSKPIGFTLH